MWCEDCSLKRAFLKFYGINRARESFVSVVMCSSDGRLHWDIQFRCPVQDWELEALDLFLDMLYSTDVLGYGADEACWKLAMRIGFEVRGFYHSLSPLLLSFLFLEKWCDNRKFLLE